MLWVLDINAEWSTPHDIWWIVIFRLINLGIFWLSVSCWDPSPNCPYRSSPHINILGASDFGYLVICLPNFGPDSQIIFSSSPFVFKMQKNLRDVRQQDYILLTGDPAVIGISCAIVSDYTSGKFNLLKWDRREAKYYPINFDLYQKG